jgi:Asp/Glu/hydantoin racemase
MFLKHFPENPSDKESNAQEQALIRRYASPGTQIDLCFPEDYPGARVTTATDANAVPGIHHQLETLAIVRKIVWAEQNGYDAVIQSNTFDPGVEAGRQAVRIPVIGVFRTALQLAATQTDSIGVTVALECHVRYTQRIIRSYGMQDFVREIQPIGFYGSNLISQKADIFARSVDIMSSMVRQGRVECVIPLGGLLFPNLVQPEELEREVGVPVLNTKLIGIRFAELCLQIGLSHSSRMYPPAEVSYEDFSALAY